MNKALLAALLSLLGIACFGLSFTTNSLDTVAPNLTL